MKKQTLIVAILSLMAVSVFAQSSDFKPSGKAEAKIFTDFSSISSNGNVNNAFQISRAYFGYGYNFSSEFSGKVLLDVASTGDGKPTVFTAFLKNAYAQYNKGSFKLGMGLIGTTAFNVQEGIWGKRFLYKSFQDEYGFSSSADLGLVASYAINKNVSVDFSVMNGEGYKKIQNDSVFRTSIGVTAQPVKNLTARIYADYSKKNAAQITLNGLLAYKFDKGSIAAEYNMQNGHGLVAGRDYSGISVYGDYKIGSAYSAFARFDNLSSVSTWNNATNGNVIIAGFQYVPVKGITLAPNVRYTSLESGKTNTIAALNVEIKF